MKTLTKNTKTEVNTATKENPGKAYKITESGGAGKPHDEGDKLRDESRQRDTNDRAKL